MKYPRDLDRQYAAHTEHQLAALASKLRWPKITTEIHQRLLLPSERKQVLADETAKYDVVEAYAALRWLRPVLAIVELAFEMDLVTVRQRERLLHDLGEETSKPTPSRHPHWDLDRGELFWNKKLVRRVRLIATNMIAILNAFQRQRWPERIDDPLPGPRDTQRRREVVRKLNKGLKGIRFRCDGDGNGILWEPRTGRARDMDRL